MINGPHPDDSSPHLTVNGRQDMKEKLSHFASSALAMINNTIDRWNKAELKQRTALAKQIVRRSDTSLVRHFITEAKIAWNIDLADVDWRPKNEDQEMQYQIALDILALVRVHSIAGHSGTSHAYAMNIINRVLNYEPIAPLTGKDDEWDLVIVDEKNKRYQNKRFSSVFKDKHGVAYQFDAIVFEDTDGLRSTNRESAVIARFPYTPNKYVFRSRSKESRSRRAARFQRFLNVNGLIRYEYPQD